MKKLKKLKLRSLRISSMSAKLILIRSSHRAGERWFGYWRVRLCQLLPLVPGEKERCTEMFKISKMVFSMKPFKVAIMRMAPFQVHTKWTTQITHILISTRRHGKREMHSLRLKHKSRRRKMKKHRKRLWLSRQLKPLLLQKLPPPQLKVVLNENLKKKNDQSIHSYWNGESK